MKPGPTGVAESVWSAPQWDRLNATTSIAALSATSESAAWKVLASQARRVLRAYSTSFFVVTRFLPSSKREQVEAIYAAVRYPDEIVDAFPWDADEKLSQLDRWQQAYDLAIECPTLQQRIRQGSPAFLAAFAQVVRDRQIPRQHYRDFLSAMRLDARPRTFHSLEDLIESYIYGSAIVVGYFLTHVYGSSTPGNFERALSAARALGIALQLTNFLRDVAEDQRRGRVYLPIDLLRKEGISLLDTRDAGQHAALRRVLLSMTMVADEHYASAARDLDAFAPDSRTAIRACIDVYSRLNQRIAGESDQPLVRQSVPTREKFRVLPASKYWRLPLAYLTGT